MPAKQADIQTDRQTYTHTGNHTGRHTARRHDRPYRESHTYRQAYMHTDRQTARHMGKGKHTGHVYRTYIHTYIQPSTHTYRARQAYKTYRKDDKQKTV